MYLYGASGHAKVIIDILDTMQLPVEGLYDDNPEITTLSTFQVKEPIDVKSPLIVSIGDNHLRKSIVEKIKNVVYSTAIHSSSIISPLTEIGSGTVVMQGAIIQSSVVAGKHCIINTGASVDHDCVLGDYVHISPHATLCGNVTVGEGTWIGAGAVVIPGIKIGKWSVIGAGSVVIKDIPDHVTAVGNPAKIIKRFDKKQFITLKKFEIISIDRDTYWDKLVKSFSQHDVYYLSGYVKAFQLHGDGEPLLFYYQCDDLRGICVMMKRDISKSIHFNNKMPENTLFDIVSPYGYGGFLFEGNTSADNIVKFERAYRELLNSENIISVFVRYHPQLNNADVFRSVRTVIDLGKTIEMDVSSEKILWENISSKNRNVIRRAEKNGVVIRQGRSMDLFDKFIEIYNRTMEKDHAEKYYFFSREFYKSIHIDLYNNYEMYYAEYNGEIIAMSIILFANGRIHYHLSGSVFEYRHLAPGNLLLYKVACWGAEHGYKTFHLGGGVGSGEDGLFKFKKAFNRYSGLQFSIGKKIYNQEKYDELVEMRQKEDAEFNVNSSYFPLYRA